jgi:hypothetical protein
MDTNTMLYLKTIKKEVKCLISKKRSLSKLLACLIAYLIVSCTNETQYEMKKSQLLSSQLLEEKETSGSRNSIKSLSIENIMNGKSSQSKVSAQNNMHYEAELTLRHYLASIISELQNIIYIQDDALKLDFELKNRSKTGENVIMNLKNQFYARHDKVSCHICNSPIIYGEHAYIYGKKGGDYKAVCNKCGLENNRKSKDNLAPETEILTISTALIVDLKSISKLAFSQEPNPGHEKFFNFHLGNLYICYANLIELAIAKLEKVKHNYNNKVTASNKEKKIPIIGYLKSVITGKEKELDELENEQKNFEDNLNYHKKRFDELTNLTKSLYIHNINKSCEPKSGSYLLHISTIHFLKALSVDKLYNLTELPPHGLKTILLIFSLFQCFSVPQPIIATIADIINKSDKNLIHIIPFFSNFFKDKIDLIKVNKDINDILSLIEQIVSTKYTELDLLDRYDQIKIRILCNFFHKESDRIIEFMCNFAHSISPDTHPSDFETFVKRYTGCNNNEVIKIITDKQNELNLKIMDMSILLECPNATLLNCIIDNNLLSTLQPEELRVLYRIDKKVSIKMIKLGDIEEMRKSLQKSNLRESLEGSEDEYRNNFFAKEESLFKDTCNYKNIMNLLNPQAEPGNSIRAIRKNINKSSSPEGDLLSQEETRSQKHRVLSFEKMANDNYKPEKEFSFHQSIRSSYFSSTSNKFNPNSLVKEPNTFEPSFRKNQFSVSKGSKVFHEPVKKEVKTDTELKEEILSKRESQNSKL